MPQPRVPITDDLEALLEVLPPPVRSALVRRGRMKDLVEIVLDLGRVPQARLPDQVINLDLPPVTHDDLVYVTGRLSAFGKDNRAGIERTLHRISAIRNRRGDVIGLTCRVGRAVFGTVDILRSDIESGASILLLGRPGVGKTTLLREAARVLADELQKRVIIVDTSNEIAGDGDIPHPGIGGARRMQVAEPALQHAVMIEAVENHMPQVIVIDEIGTEAEARAARTIAERGVQLIATAHGTTLETLLKNPTLEDLVGGIQAVTLSDEEARRRGTQKTVLERKSAPTFNVVVELLTQDRLAVHRDVGEVVDDLLRGTPPHPELRTRSSDGKVHITETPVPMEETWEEEAPALRDDEVPPPTTSLSIRGRLVRIYPHAVNRERLERAIRELKSPAILTDFITDADVMVTIRSQERRQPRRMKDAQAHGIPLHVLRGNSMAQMFSFLKEVCPPRGDGPTSSAARLPPWKTAQ
ncbi:MAG: AAA family ATPase [Myxococcota bacterium]